MQLTINRVFETTITLATIMREKRPMPQIGKFRVARMHAKLLPEFNTANTQRDDLIAKYGAVREDGQTEVPAERMPDFTAEWNPIAESTIEVDIEPLRLADITIDGNGAIESSELQMLGDLVTE